MCMYALCNFPDRMAFLFRKLHSLDKGILNIKCRLGFVLNKLTAEPF